MMAVEHLLRRELAVAVGIEAVEEVVRQRVPSTLSRAQLDPALGEWRKK